MATVNTKATIITNADATPPTLNAPYLAGGRLREQVATVEVAAADDNNSIYRMGRVHSSWRVSQIDILNDAVQSGTQYDLGLLQTAENGGAATGADDDVWGTAISMTSARVAPLDATFEALNIDKIEKRVFELLGLTNDPNRYYDVAFSADAVGSGAGTISTRIRYVDGS